MNHQSVELGRKQTQKHRDQIVDRLKVCILIALSVSIILWGRVGFVHAAPVVYTFDATDVTSISATLNGLIANPGYQPPPANPSSISWRFEWWTGSGAGSVAGQCPTTNAVMVNSPSQPAGCPLSGLTPETTYKFYLEARETVSGSGDTNWHQGATLSFTTSFPIMTGIMTATIKTFPKSVTTSATTSSQPQGPAFDFALSVSPSAVSVQQGGTAHYAVGVTYSDPSYAGTLINLQLSGGGPGMQWSVTPAGDLAISTLQSTPTGSYALTLIGSANGVSRQTGATLIVIGAQQATTAVTTATIAPTSSPAATATSTAPFDYSVTVSPSTQSAQRGGSASYVVSVLPLSGSPVPVSLTLMGCPGDVRNGFTVQSGNPPYTSTLNLDLSSTSANAGAYTLTVLASAGGNVKTATATLMIQEKTAQTIFTQTTATSGTNWSDVLSSQQNQLLLLLLLLAVVLGVLGFKFGRRDRKVPSTISAPHGFCASCGAVMGEGNQFCPKCGAKRPGS